jgi:isopenicillin N synthase-like dioxygenase
MAGNWVDVPCDFGMLIINIGDMLQEASQGYYPSTQHRVVNPQGGRTPQPRLAALVPASATGSRAIPTAYCWQLSG